MTARALMATAIAGLFHGLAHSDGAVAPELSGQWTFKSWTYDNCSFGGVASFTPTAAPDEYACELTARQECPSISWTVHQSCTARRTDDRVTVTSAIETFLDGPETENYWPDNFILKMHSSDRMTGSLVSHGVHPSEFTRDPGATS